MKRTSQLHESQIKLKSMLDFNKKHYNDNNDDNDYFVEDIESCEDSEEKDFGEMPIDLVAMRLIRQHDYMHLFQLSAFAARKLDQIVNKKEYNYEVNVLKSVEKAS